MISFKYTTAGLSAIASGKALVIDQVGFGSSGYTPSVGATSLQAEQIKTAPDSAIVKDNKITLIKQLSGAQEFSVREIGIYLDDGTLLCIWSSTTQVAGEKVANTIFKISIVLELSGVDTSNVSFTINDFAKAELHTHINNKDNPHEMTWSKLPGKPSTFTPSSHMHPWSAITNKPSTFNPSSHMHPWSAITDKPDLVTQTQLATKLSGLNELVLVIAANTVAGATFGVVSNIAVNATDEVGIVVVPASHSDNFHRHTSNVIILKPRTTDKDYVLSNTRAQLSANTAYKAKAFVRHINRWKNPLSNIFYSNLVSFTSSVNRNWRVSGASNLQAAKAMVANWRRGDTITYSWQSAYHVGTGNGSATRYRTQARTQTC